MDVDFSFYVKSISTFASTFLGYIILVLASVLFDEKLSVLLTTYVSRSALVMVR